MALENSTANDIYLELPLSDDRTTLNNYFYRNFAILRSILAGGASGSFTTHDSKTVTVVRGIITDIT